MINSTKGFFQKHHMRIIACPYLCVWRSLYQELYVEWIVPLMNLTVMERVDSYHI